MPGPTPPDGFAGFVVDRSAALLRAAWLLTGDPARAEDLLQTALAATWPRWRQVEAGGNPEGYVRKALYHAYLSWWRRRWRDELPTAAPPDRGDPADHTESHALRDAVRRALAGLSRQQRAIVVLRYAEDLSVADTAAVLGCSPQTVRVQASRALARLRTDPHLRLDGLTATAPALGEEKIR
jgi:RNA polymerase sigma-70 factor (sigma-E family)